LLAVYLRELEALLGAFRASGGDAESSGIRSAVLAECSTIGRTVSIERPGVAPVVGLAVDLDGDGRLVVDSSAGSGQDSSAGSAQDSSAGSAQAVSGSRLSVAVGDVTHLRH
jgi:BirA family biotin operon repressor/biotin-[acetyl-CoA-carboxylase] ligase